MNENYEELKKAAYRISKSQDLSEELLHYCIEEFLAKKDSSDIVASGGGRFYIVRIMMNQWNSVTSPFYHTYRKHYDELTEEIPDNGQEEDEYVIETATRAREELDRLSWYDRVLFDTFVNENHTVSSLARGTDIPRTSISLTINRIRKHLRNKLNGDI
jgi:DNA-directed RNA polymerase specialized sigma24 family protein